MNILLVEENPLMAQVLESMFEMYGRVVVTNSGGEAWQLFCEGREGEEFNLLVADYRLTTLSGLQLLKMVRKRDQEHGSYCPVVMTSSFSSPSIEAQCFEAGCDEFLPKPIRLTAIQSALSKVRFKHKPAACIVP